MKKCLIIFISFLFCGQDLLAQTGISFYINTELDRMMAIAQRENKDIFIDTYTQWCIPCKKLDKVFTDRELGNYFNDHFVNVKFDMESDAGRALQSKYDIFFMPTLLILDKFGNVKIMWDRGLIEADALLDMALKVHNPPVVAEAISIKEAPLETQLAESVPEKKAEAIVMQKPIVTKVNPQELSPDDIVLDNPEEKILYVMDSEAEVPDFVLYEEAYFRLQLMDGSHKETAKKYLETQEDWLSPKNIRFIHDFLYTTNSVEFKYITDNLPAFEKELGKEQLIHTIRILGNKRLFRGVPRPELSEAMALFSLMETENPARKAQKYFATRLFTEDTPSEYITFAEGYIDGLGDDDAEEMDRLAMTKVSHSQSKKSIKACVRLLNKSIALNPSSRLYLENMAYVYYRANNKKKALEFIQAAYQLAKDQDSESEFNGDLLQKIEAL